MCKGLSSAYMASHQQSRKGGPRGAAGEQAEGRCSWAQRPYLPGRAEDSLGAAAASAMEAQELVPAGSLGVFLPEEEESPQRAPWNLGLGGAFSGFPDCSCSV